MPTTLEFLTPSDVAIRLKQPYGQVLRLIFTGKLEATRDGRHYRIDTASVERFERAQGTAR
ncbi:MAG: excisionase family DNA-binding protein [Gemmatimonadales bacterium]